MGLLGKKKRKALKSEPKGIPNNVHPISVEAMVINISQGINYYFKGLRYNDFPEIITDEKSNGNFVSGVELIEINREDFIRECWDILNSLNINATTKIYFDSLIRYVKYLDTNSRIANFEEENILAFHTHLRNLADKGEIYMSRNKIKEQVANGALSIVEHPTGFCTNPNCDRICAFETSTVNCQHEIVTPEKAKSRVPVRNRLIARFNTLNDEMTYMASILTQMYTQIKAIEITWSKHNLDFTSI